MRKTGIRAIARDSPFCESRILMSDIEDDLTNDEAMAATHDQIERLLAEKGRELLRQMMQTHYDAKAARERRVVVQGTGTRVPNLGRRSDSERLNRLSPIRRCWEFRTTSMDATTSRHGGWRVRPTPSISHTM